jgi:glycerol kinase
LNADGGGVRNSYLMQLLSDLSGKEIKSSKLAELSAFGAAMVAALGAKLLSISEIESINLEYDQYKPKLTEKMRQENLLIWRRALSASRVKN